METSQLWSSLHLSVAFDTVDHDILCRRLQLSFGLDGPALAWFRSYLQCRSQYVRRDMIQCSSVMHLLCGVRQGLVLGPILFIMYTADLVALTEQHGFYTHILITPTTRKYMGLAGGVPDSDLQERLSACIDDVYSWMLSNYLQLNTNKSELFWCVTTRQQHQIPRSTLTIGCDAAIPWTTVCDLGIYIDADLSMRSQVQRTVANCRSIRRSVPSSVFQTLIVSRAHATGLL